MRFTSALRSPIIPPNSYINPVIVDGKLGHETVPKHPARCMLIYMVRGGVGCSPASDALFLTTFPALPFAAYTFNDPSDDSSVCPYLSEHL